MLQVMALLGAVAGAADEVVYGDALAPNWYDWSWSGRPDFASPDAYEGSYAAFTALKPTGAFSIQRSSGFADASALRFWAKGSGTFALRFDAVAEGILSSEFPLSPPLSNKWTQYTFSLDTLTPNAWSRISWIDVGEEGGALHVDLIELLEDDPDRSFFHAAEPMPPNRVAVFGAGDVESVEMSLNGTPLTVTDVFSKGGPARTYFELEEPLTDGTLRVLTSDGLFVRQIVSASVQVGTDTTHRISDEIYGANFPSWPPSPAEMARYGYSVVRWGGDARAMYNPATRTTNLAENYFFLNEVVHPSLETWYREMDPELATVLTVPNLGRVASAQSVPQFSVAKYGPQQEVAPGNPDAGNGVHLDGTFVDNDVEDATVPFTPTDAQAWLASLDSEPDYLAIGNEHDIAHITHRGAWGTTSADYDERLAHFLDYAVAAKAAIPRASVLGPVSCCWFYYWNTADPAHKAASGGRDFLPWFLDQVREHDDALGERTLDYLDLHYYPENLIAKDWKNKEGDAVDAWRLRATRSLWDPTFVDESWVGVAAGVTEQPVPNAVQLLPRMKALIAEHYPGTRLAITEWGFGDLQGPAGGLAAADALGIFGREDVDMALVWPSPRIGGYVAAAFELYRSGAPVFAPSSLPVDVSGLDQGLLGVYAAQETDGTTTLAIVNKSPDTDLRLDLVGVALTSVRTKHFGGAAGARVIETPTGDFAGWVLVPAYSAMLVGLVPAERDEPSTDDEACCVDTGALTGDDDRVAGGRSCLCGPSSTGDPVGAWWTFGIAAGLLVRRRTQSSRA